MQQLNWKAGFEIELIAPAGMDRSDLASALAGKAGGSITRVFHPQSEPSKVPGLPVFENLTLAFDAVDGAGAPIARCADDLTIIADLDRTAPPKPGWYRIVSDDARLLRLIAVQCGATETLQRVLLPVADLFRTSLIEGDGMVRLSDDMNQSIAIATGLPGQRERPCEIITPPITHDHGERLSNILTTARDLGFGVPVEAAVHVHFDAGRLRSSACLAHLVRVLHRHGSAMRTIVGTNPNCVRLGPIPDEQLAVVNADGFSALPWPEAQSCFADVGLKKYCDFNLMNMIRDVPGKPTFEVRIFPGSMDPKQIIHGARLFETILNWCVESAPDTPTPDSLDDLLSAVV